MSCAFHLKANHDTVLILPCFRIPSSIMFGRNPSKVSIAWGAHVGMRCEKQRGDELAITARHFTVITASPQQTPSTQPGDVQLYDQNPGKCNSKRCLEPLRSSIKSHYSGVDVL